MKKILLVVSLSLFLSYFIVSAQSTSTVNHGQVSAESGKTSIFLAADIGLSLLLLLIIFNNRQKTQKLNEIIFKQQEGLARSESEKEQVFRVFGHDIKEPINVLLSFNQLVEYGNIPPEKLALYTGELKKTLSTTAFLMDNLFHLGISHTEEFTPVIERFDIHQTVKEAIDSLSPLAENKKIRLQNNIPTGTMVLADLNMTASVLRNLISNAIKYSLTNEMIELFSESTANHIVISVKDNGTGMDEKLVQQFNTNDQLQFVGSKIGTNKERGTGLGLILSKKFAKLMRGSISVKSDEGKGSIFSIILPS